MLTTGTASKTVYRFRFLPSRVDLDCMGEKDTGDGMGEGIGEKDACVGLEEPYACEGLGGKDDGEDDLDGPVHSPSKSYGGGVDPGEGVRTSWGNTSNGTPSPCKHPGGA